MKKVKKKAVKKKIENKLWIVAIILREGKKVIAETYGFENRCCAEEFMADCDRGGFVAAITTKRY
jgi:hypothetical protein